MLEAVLFYLFAVAAVALGVVVVTRRSPIHSAVSLVACFFFLAGMYAMLDAHFLAVIQLLVYAGAIMVLFIFVIMLLNLRSEGPSMREELNPRALAGMAAAGLVGIAALVGLDSISDQTMGVAGADYGSIEQVGAAMFGGSYLLPFEVASALLTVAMIGAVVLAKREI